MVLAGSTFPGPARAGRSDGVSRRHSPLDGFRRRRRLPGRANDGSGTTLRKLVDINDTFFLLTLGGEREREGERVKERERERGMKELKSLTPSLLIRQ